MVVERGWGRGTGGIAHLRSIILTFLWLGTGLNLAGPSGRFSRSLMKKIASHPGSGGAVSNNSAVENEEVGTVLRQVCWQWAWELNVAEWNRRVGGVK